MSNIPPATDNALLQASSDRLLAAVSSLDDASLGAASHLPGWTRGHVVAHLARNADALLNVLRGGPMYADEAVREADIERDAPRVHAEQLKDLRESASRLAAAFAAEDDASWERTVELRNGVVDRAGSLPFRRRAEVELHHVDLAIGYTLDDLPADFVERELAAVAERFEGHPQLADSVELRAEAGGIHHTGAPGEPAVVVTGTATALLGWVTGRTDGSGLSANTALPVLPGL